MVSLEGDCGKGGPELTACDVTDDRENNRSESENFLLLRSFLEFTAL